MLLVVAVLIGLIAGLLRAWIGKRNYRIDGLKAKGLILLAFIPQFFIFLFPFTRDRFSNNLASIFFVGSLLFLTIFALINIRISGFWPISAGFLMNAVVILLNGGWMPISPEMVRKLIPNAEAGSWQLGERLGFSKDIVLTPQATRLAFLADRFSLPDWLHYRVAFSLGDIFIFLGVIWLLWLLGGKEQVKRIGVIE